MKYLPASAALLCALGCAARPATSPIGVSADVPPASEPRAASAPKAAEPPADVVARAALPISGLRARDGHELPAGPLFDELSRYEAICIGESHEDAHHHYAELALLGELERRARHQGKLLAVGFEMFQSPFQEALSSYGQSALGEKELLEKSEWDKRWGFPFAYYRPLLELGRARGLPLLAINARREVTRAVASSGVAELPPELRRELPVLDLENREHRAAFDQAMEGHPPGHGSPDDLYAAQVIWDETMAQHAASFVGRGAAMQIVIVAGSAHCRRSAVPARFERRGSGRAAAVLASVGKPQSLDGFDYALVMDAAE